MFTVVRSYNIDDIHSPRRRFQLHQWWSGEPRHVNVSHLAASGRPAVVSSTEMTETVFPPVRPHTRSHGTASPSRGGGFCDLRDGGQSHLHVPYLAARRGSAVPVLRRFAWCRRRVPAEAATWPPEGVSEAAGDAAGHVPDDAGQPAVLQLRHAHVVLQLLGGHVDVAAVPEHPPDEAEEDDDGAGVDEQVVDGQAAEDARHHDDQAQDVVRHGEPEGALAAAHPAVLDLRHGLHPHLRRHGDGGSSPLPTRTPQNWMKWEGGAVESFACVAVKCVWRSLTHRRVQINGFQPEGTKSNDHKFLSPVNQLVRSQATTRLKKERKKDKDTLSWQAAGGGLRFHVTVRPPLASHRSEPYRVAPS